MKKIKILIPTLAISALPTCLVPLSVSCSSKSTQAVDFATDSWETVANLAKQGIDALCNAYGHDANWFIGQTRTVYVNGVAHQVVVVGTNHDIVSKNEKAALTFQFTTVISDPNKHAMLTYWNKRETEGNKNFWKTDIYYALNGGGTDTIEWLDPSYNKTPTTSCVLNMFDKDENNNLADLIQPVYRKVNVYLNGVWIRKAKPVSLFLPSLSSIYDESVIGTSGSTKDYTEKYLDEDDMYSWYHANVKDATFLDSCEALVKKDCAGETMSYWLTTPIVGSSTGSWVISKNGGAGQDFNPMAVAPCFCL